MVNGMGGLEPKWPMHQAVRPIKPSVVHKQIEENRHRQIPQWKRGHIGVDLSPAQAIPAPSDNARRNAVDSSTGQAPADLTPDLAVKAIVQAWRTDLGCPGKCAADKQIARAHYERHRRSRHNHDMHIIHVVPLAFLRLF